MPYCTQCGRQLRDGEKCDCTSSAPRQGYSNAQQPYINGYPQQYGQNMNRGMQYPPPPNYPPPYEPYPYQYISYPPAKKSNAWIWAIIIPVAIFIAITIAILVPAFRQAREKVSQTDANSYAYNISKTSGQILSELNKEEENIKGLYIISSDTESNVAVPFDTGIFYERMKEYFDGANEREYFIIVRNGKVEYTAASKSWTDRSEAVASYPSGKTTAKRYDLSGYSTKERESDTLDILYWDAYDQIFSETSD